MTAKDNLIKRILIKKAPCSTVFKWPYQRLACGEPQRSEQKGIFRALLFALFLIIALPSMCIYIYIHNFVELA